MCPNFVMYGGHTRFWWRCLWKRLETRVRCAWAKFKELSPNLTVRGASYRIIGRIYSACVQSVLIYGLLKLGQMKADDLRSSGKDRTYDGEMDVWWCP